MFSGVQYLVRDAPGNDGFQASGILRAQGQDLEQARHVLRVFEVDGGQPQRFGELAQGGRVQFFERDVERFQLGDAESIFLALVLLEPQFADQ